MATKDNKTTAKTNSVKKNTTSVDLEDKNIIHQTELIKELGKKLADEFPVAHIKKIIKGMFELMSEFVAQGYTVRLPGELTASSTNQKDLVRKPNSENEWTKPRFEKICRMKPGNAFKNRVNDMVHQIKSKKPNNKNA